MRPFRRITRLEHLWVQHFLTWAEALRMADALLFACALHVSPATTAAIAKEFAAILAAHRKE